MNMIEYLNAKGAIDFFDSQPVKRAYLFGSYSRGDETRDSDIDILVDLEKSVDLFRLVSI